LVIAELSTLARPISGMWFDKLPEANWRVPWHQDVHLPVIPFTGDGWGPWSSKDGLPMVQAPEPWLSRRIALRLHLDHCGAENGPLQIIPGSHRHGVLSPDAVSEIVAGHQVHTVHAEPGDVLIMHPLLLHRSSPARKPDHRRVIHVEWCDAPLPPGAAWLDAMP
jgi:ectoine hydroxylase-related dioxygenase (phytanoyl-CoA dioxygenase family)